MSSLSPPILVCSSFKFEFMSLARNKMQRFSCVAEYKSLSVI